MTDFNNEMFDYIKLLKIQEDALKQFLFSLPVGQATSLMTRLSFIELEGIQKRMSDSIGVIAAGVK